MVRFQPISKFGGSGFSRAEPWRDSLRRESFLRVSISDVDADPFSGFGFGFWEQLRLVVGFWRERGLGGGRMKRREEAIGDSLGYF